eukprot:1210739-Heterocapsa_arctica.AAC.1
MAAAAIKDMRHVDRRVVEYCIGAHCKIGDDRYMEDGCEVIRLTIADDVTTRKGHDEAMAAVRGRRSGS